METKQQYIVVRAYIEQGSKVLLVRRPDDDTELANKFELPGGKVEFGESAEQALQRELKEELGQVFDNFILNKVYSYTYSDVHVIGICYSLAADNQFIPKLDPGEHSDYKWVAINSIEELPVTDELSIILDLNSTSDVVTTTTKYSSVKLYTDGGSRGNPGPSALGYVIYDDIENVIETGSRYLGITTNNQAEYQAVKAGLESCLRLGVDKVQVFLDSQLVANQMNGIYKIKNRDLWPIHESIKNMTVNFNKGVTFTYIPRELNKAADAKVNEELDKATSNS